jgi:hypothetical protein
MKRAAGLYEHIISYQNIRLAYIKTLRGKRNSYAARLFTCDADDNFEIIHERLTAAKVEWRAYKKFTITDPKLRVISAAPFEDRVIHHALMNMLEPVFERQFIDHSYACRKGRGTHAAVLYSFAQCRKFKYFIKCDVRKYFDSIDHAVLKGQLRRIIKDKTCVTVLDSLIDSYETAPRKGLPIGNLTSQFFANLYLSCMDHFILETVRPGAYVRYMDDFVLWTDNRQDVATYLDALHAFTDERLKLVLKQPVIGETARGLPFLGFLIKQKGIYLTRKSKERVIKNAKIVKHQLYKGVIDEAKAAEKARSIMAAVALARALSLRRTLWSGCRFGG